MLKTYQVSGDIKIVNVEVDVQASSEEDAIEKAKAIFNDMYTLGVTGAYHLKEQVEYDLTAGTYSN